MEEKKRIVLKHGERFPGEFVRASLEAEYDVEPEGEGLIVEIVSSGEIRLSNGVTLRLPPVVGTGMGGRLRRMANQIYRATYVKVRDNEARMSVVHGLDVGRAVAIAASGAVAPGEYEVAGEPVAVNRMADALARRMTDKRIVDLTAAKARWWALGLDIITLGQAGARESLREDTTDSIMGDGEKFASAFGFIPRDAAEYISTHEYGPEDI